MMPDFRAMFAPLDYSVSFSGVMLGVRQRLHVTQADTCVFVVLPLN